MDPLSIVVLTTQLLVIIAKTAQIAKGVQAASNTTKDPKFKSIEAKLFTERTRLSLWLNYVEHQPGGAQAVLEYIGDPEQSAIARFTLDAQYLLEDAERRFEKYNPVGKGYGGRIQAALFWSLPAYDDLKALIDAVSSINTALEKVVTPPPGYHGGSFSPREEPARQHPRPRAASQPCPPPEPDSATSDIAPPAQPRPRVIHYLYRHSLCALRLVQSFNSETRSLELLAAKLERWGEILEDPLALDLLVKPGFNGALECHDSLWECIVTILVDIILLEGNAPYTISSAGKKADEDCVYAEAMLTEIVKSDPRSDLKRGLLETISCLAVGGAVEIAISRAMPTIIFANLDELLQRGGQELGDAVDDLYQLVPTIWILRRGAMIDSERSQNNTQINQVMRAGESSVAGGSELTDHSIEEAETWELLNRAVELISPPSAGLSKTERSESVHESVSRLAGKEVEMLRAWGATHAAALRGSNKTLADDLLKGFIQDETVRQIPVHVQGKEKGEEWNEKKQEYLKYKITTLVGDLPRSF